MSSRRSAVSAADLLAHWRLASIYCLGFAVLGGLMPYWGLYLQARGLTAVEIGQVLAVVAVTKILAPHFWGWLADRGGHRLWVIRAGLTGALLIFCGLLFTDGYASLLLILLGFDFCWSILAQLDAVAVERFGSRMHQYGAIRLWGSLGFVAAVLGMGWLFDHYGVLLLPIVVLFLIAGTLLSSFAVAEPPIHDKLPSQHGFYASLRAAPSVVLFGLCVLLQISHGPYYAFFSIYLDTLGYSGQQISGYWTLGVLAEILVFVSLRHFYALVSLPQLLLLSLLGAALRWWMIAYWADEAWLLVLAQLLHGLSFGLNYAVVMALLYSYFPGQYRGRVQALYASLTLGLGGAVGYYLSGRLWQSQLGLTFTYAAAVAMLAAAVCGLGLRRLHYSGRVAE